VCGLRPRTEGGDSLMPTTWDGEPLPAVDLTKPARGFAKYQRREKHAKADNKEARNKTAVRKRDGYTSRWPDDDGQPLEVAHLTHKGMGGDITTTRSTPDRMILVSRAVHQGPRSLHSGDRRVVFLTPERTNGPVAFLEKRGMKWVEIARELWPGTLAPKKDQR
jgi:hypothetical protein